MPFLASLDEVQEELLYYPCGRRWSKCWGGVCISKTFYIKVYLMGKGLSGEYPVSVTGLVYYYYFAISQMNIA